jgi:hypothetical protein
MKRNVGFKLPMTKLKLPNLSLRLKVHPSVSALNMNRENNHSKLEENLKQGGIVGITAAHRIVNIYPSNNLRTIINKTPGLNATVGAVLLNGWVQKVINEGNIKQISKIVGLRLNLNYSTKRRLMNAMEAHLISIITDLIKSGTANQIQNFLNKVNFKKDVATRNMLLSIWSLRRQNTPTLHKMIEHLSSAPYQTKMSKATLASLRAELNRRRIH